MIPASSMWPRVGNRFFTCSDEAKLKSIVTRWFALEQSRVNDVSKRSSKELRVVENWHCVLAMAQERRTSKAARYIIRLDSFWKSLKVSLFVLGSPLLLGKYLNAGHPQALYERNDQVAGNCSSHQAPPGYFIYCQFSLFLLTTTFIFRPHLSSWPCIQVEINRQHESGQGMILYWPHHLANLLLCYVFVFAFVMTPSWQMQILQANRCCPIVNCMLKNTSEPGYNDGDVESEDKRHWNKFGKAVAVQGYLLKFLLKEFKLCFTR